MTTPADEERLVTGYSGRVLLLIVAGTAVTFVGRNIFGPLLPAIIDDLGITSSAAGLALSVMWVAIAITQYPGGRLADQLSYKTVLVGSMSLLVVGFALLAQSSTYVGFVVALVVMGLGGGLFTPSSYAQLAALFEERRGQAFGVYTASVDVGSALSGAVAIGVLAVATWYVAFLPIAAVLFVVVVATHFLHRGRYEFDLSGVRLDVETTLRRLFGDPEVRETILAYVALGLIFQGVLGFLPAFLQFAKGFSGTLANNFFIGFFVLGAGVRVLSGHLGDRFGYLTVAVGATVVGSAGLVLLYVAATLPTVALGAALLAAGMTGYPPVLNAYLMDWFPDTSMGGDYGAARSVLILLGSVGPTYVGYVANGFGYNVSFLALLPFFVIAGLLLLRVRSREAVA